jgi:peptide-methionine (S)-S-oxide reductase
MFGIFSDKKSTIPTASEAFPGRSEAIVPPAKHYVNGHPMNPPYPAGMEMAMFGIGCFWGAERKFWQQAGVYLWFHTKPHLSGSLYGDDRPQ